jgi:hypothetical protein
VVTEDLKEVNGSGSVRAGGGYVMVSHRRTYSDQSLRSVGEGGVLFSTPDEKEWAEGQGQGEVWMGGGVMSVEGEVEMDVEGEERSMPHDPKLVLHHLGSNGMSFFSTYLTLTYTVDLR